MSTDIKKRTGEDAPNNDTLKTMSTLKLSDEINARSIKFNITGAQIAKNITLDALLEAKKMVDVAAIMEKLSNAAMTQSTIASEVMVTNSTSYAWNSCQYFGTLTGEASFFKPILAGVDVIKTPDTSSGDYIKGVNGLSEIDFPNLSFKEYYGAPFVSVGHNHAETKKQLADWRKRITKKGGAVKKFIITEFNEIEYLVVFRYATPIEAYLKKAKFFTIWAKWGFTLECYTIANNFDHRSILKEYIGDAGNQKINLGFGSFPVNDYFGSIAAATSVYIDTILPPIHNALVAHVSHDDLIKSAEKVGISKLDLLLDVSVIDPGKSIMSILSSAITKALTDSATDPQQDNFASIRGITFVLRKLIPQTMVVMTK